MLPKHGPARILPVGKRLREQTTCDRYIVVLLNALLGGVQIVANKLHITA